MGNLVQTVGRTLGAIFLLKEVQGLPPVPGVDLNQPVNRLTRRLPPDYMEAFAENLLKQLSRWVKADEDMLDEAVSTWLVRFVAQGGWAVMPSGMTLRQANSFVLVSLKNQALNLRKKYRPRDIEVVTGDDEKEAVEDPAALERLIESRIWREPAVRRILEQQAHPDAPLYLDLLVEGHTMAEIVGDWRQDRPSMLPHVQQKPVTPQAWWGRTMPKILEVLRAQSF